MQGGRHLPDSDAGSRLSERSPERATQFKSVRTNLNQIVHQRPERCHRKHGREEEDVTELQKQLQIVVKRALCHPTNTRSLLPEVFYNQGSDTWEHNKNKVNPP